MDEAFDSLVADTLSSKTPSTICFPATTGGATTSCATASSGCNQCSGADDDKNDDDEIMLDDDGDDDDNRRLSSSSGTGGGDSKTKGSLLTYSITAYFPDDEDPGTVINDVESILVDFFADEQSASAALIEKARALGVDVSEDTQVTFSEPVVDNNSVSISRPDDFMTHHYNSNSNVRLGTWIAAGLAGVGLMVSAKYGMKAYQLKHGADVIEQAKAAEWANMEENGGELTMNPLTGEGGANDIGAKGVRHRSGSGHVAL